MYGKNNKLTDGKSRPGQKKIWEHSLCNEQMDLNCLSVESTNTTASMRSAEESHVYLKQRFVEFLDTVHRGSINYHKVIEELLQHKERRFAIDLNALRQFDPDLALG